MVTILISCFSQSSSLTCGNWIQCSVRSLLAGRLCNCPSQPLSFPLPSSLLLKFLRHDLLSVSHVHHPFDLHGFVSVMPNLAVFFLCYTVLCHIYGHSAVSFIKRLIIRMTSHTHSSLKASKYSQPDPDYYVNHRGGYCCPYYSIQFCASVPLRRKAMEREEGATKTCSQREVTVPSPLHKARSIKLASSPCLLGLLHIPLALLEPNGFAGPHQLYPK